MTDATQLARDWLYHDRKAWAARSITAWQHFDAMDVIVRQVKELGLEDGFDAIVMPHGFKSVRRWAGY